jgi:HD-like signal output (HDOD) protein/ActR/RegA family two-component response regulator
MKRILFVDDDQNLLDGIRRMMRCYRDGWEMEFVASGEAALVACGERKYDVVISDLRMPGMDGAQLMSEIRERHPEIARLILSGYAGATITAKAMQVAHRVLAKPCEPLQLIEAIEQVCAWQEVLREEALLRVIGSMGELPALSNTYMELSSAVQHPKVAAATITKIIEQDAGMAAKILHVVNCGFFGRGQRASSVAQAVGTLGADVIHMVALQTEASRIFRPNAKVASSFWEGLERHSRHTAIIAGTLPVAREIRELTMMAALLHDAGALALASAMSEEFALVLEEMERRDCSQEEAEEIVLGISHAEVGAYLLGQWGIHGMAAEAIAQHHQPNRMRHEGLDGSLAVYLSDLIALDLERPGEGGDKDGLRAVDRMELETLGLMDRYDGFRRGAMAALDMGAR